LSLSAHGARLGPKEFLFLGVGSFFATT
jgi:hypothetical protein